MLVNYFKVLLKMTTFSFLTMNFVKNRLSIPLSLDLVFMELSNRLSFAKSSFL